MAIQEKKRSEIEDIYKWDLTPIYKNEEEFLKEYEEMKKEIKKIEVYNNHLLDNAETLYKALELDSDISRKMEKLYTYAHLNYDSETNNTKYDVNHQKMENLYQKYCELSSYFVPQLLKADIELIKKFKEECPKLERFKMELDDIFRYKDHTLSEVETKLLSKYGNILGQSSEIYNKLTDTDMKFGIIKDSEGNEVEMTESNYSVYLQDRDRKVRKDAFDLMYKTYKNFINTIACTYKNFCELQKVEAEVKNFNSSLEESLFHDSVDVSIYENLINSVNEGLEPLYRYYKIKKEILNLDEFHLYDNYVDLIELEETDYTFEQAKELVIKALSVLGDDYITDLKKAFDEKWIDIYPNVSKRGGAYSGGCYDTNPYVLLNYQGKLDDVSTLAHELGHSMHSYYSKKANSYEEADYKIFVAEVASTVNELLLCKYIINNSKNREEKLNVLNRMLDLFKGTLYRQTMFAEFEKKAHEMCENDEILTSENLCSMYYDLNKKYFGDDVVVDEQIKYEWARIPHFYYNFYVYKYATGISAACYIVNNILSGDKLALENYKKFLSLGGSMKPVDELKVAGVDMNDKEVVNSAIKMFDETLDDFVKVYKKI